MNIAAQRHEIERTRIGYNHALMSFPIYIKAGRKRVNVAKEVATVNKLRLSMERSLTSRMISLFKSVGNDAAREYRAGGVIDGAMANMKPKLNKIFRAHYTSVIDTFASFANQDRKADSPFQRLIERYHTTYTAQKVTGITETTRVMMQSVILSADEEGLGVAGTAKLLREFGDGNISRARAATIARTETHGAASWAQHEQHKENDFPMIKRWVSVGDARTREHHSAMNGTEVKMDDDFEVVYRGIVYPMAYTHDPRGGAANNINCRCVTLYFADDDVVFDDEPTEPDTPVPAPEPVVAINRNAPIQPQNLASLTIVSKADAKKRLEIELEEAAKDQRYINMDYRIYSGVKASNFGKAVFTKEFTDESATVILALKKEIDEICDRIEVPHIRSIVVNKSRSYNMAMGDGTLFINYEYVNSLTGALKRKNLSQADLDNEKIKIQNQIDEITGEMNANSAEMALIYEKIDDLRSRRREFDSTNDYFVAYNAEVEKYKKLGSKNKRLHKKKTGLRNQISDLGRPEELKVSSWNPSMPISERPHSSKEYLADPLDRVRHTMYHEIGHQIHQNYKTSPIGARGVQRPLDSYLEKAGTERLLYGGGRRGRLNNPDAAKETWSTYGNYNGHEWFAENNANYWTGARERVDPKFIKMMDAILDGEDINDSVL